MRPGSLLIWDSRTPHGNYPNEGFDWRMVMYVTMDINSNTSEAILAENNQVLLSYLKEHWINLTPLGRRIAGLVSWEDETDLLESL